MEATSLPLECFSDIKRGKFNNLVTKSCKHHHSFHVTPEFLLRVPERFDLQSESLLTGQL